MLHMAQVVPWFLCFFLSNGSHACQQAQACMDSGSMLVSPQELSLLVSNEQPLQVQHVQLAVVTALQHSMACCYHSWQLILVTCAA